MKIFLATILFSLLYFSSLTAQWVYVTPPEMFYGGNYVINHDGELYFANNEDIWKTSDEGNSWTNLTNGFVTEAGNSNLFIQFAGSNIFVASTLLAVFMSPDNGSSWQLDTVGLEGSYNASLLYCDGTNIFASMNYPTYGLYMKAASQGAWTRVNSNSIGSSYLTNVMGMTKIGNVLYAATRSSGFYESSDNGVTWTQKASTNYPNPVEGQVSNRLTYIGSDLFVACTDGVYKSTDQGDSWTRVDQGFAVWNQFNVVQIWCLYSDGTNLYASVAQDDSAYISTDAGATWSDISGGLHHRLKSFAVNNGKLFAAQWDTDSSFVRYDGALYVEKEEGINPQQFELSQNYPNPFNPSTKIKFSVPSNSFVSLKIYDALSREVAELVNEELSQGEYSVDFDAEGLAGGVYFYQLKTKSYIETKKMILLK